VRLVEGREQSAKVYDRDPVEVARGYKKEGARLIHVVDLDGAFLGASSDNMRIVRQIVEQTAVPVEVGGGIRSLPDIEGLLCEIGARYAILGTLAVEQPDVVAEAVARFGDRIVIGIDARGSRVATRGWTETTEEDVFALARRMTDMGVERIIYTDIARDGRLEGPNFETTREVARSSGARVTASGGISSLEDIKRLCELEDDGVSSVIVGKALYEGRFTLKEAIKASYGLDLGKLNAGQEDHPLP
jgi:phosphoribosylformimino-5-aminoimidazole carboxamide ribotide isomerase